MAEIGQEGETTGGPSPARHSVEAPAAGLVAPMTLFMPAFGN
jgi:hypothetical protein